MVHCPRCNSEKPESDFGVKKNDLRQPYCKPCARDYRKEHYRANREKTVKAVIARKKANVVENRKRVLQYLADHPCVDCGTTDPVVLQFDHLRDKKYIISKMVSQGYEWRTIAAEIAKCAVRCANCHARKTAKEFGWYCFSNV